MKKFANTYKDLKSKIAVKVGTVSGTGMDQKTTYSEEATIWAWVSEPMQKRIFKDGVVSYKTGYNVTIRWKQRFEADTDVRLVLNKGLSNEKEVRVLAWNSRDGKKVWTDIKTVTI